MSQRTDDKGGPGEFARLCLAALGWVEEAGHLSNEKIAKEK